MSDGALSQAEIDALLAGTDSPSSAAAAVAGGSNDTSTIQGFLAGTVGALSSNLSMMTGKEVSLRGPQVVSMTRDDLVQKLPDMVTVVKADFNSGFPGEHCFLFPEEAAKAIAALMNKEENIELDEMSLSVLGEVVSTIVGAQITDLTNKTGNKSIANVAPEAANVAKAVAALPGGNFTCAAYQLALGDDKTYDLWEVYGQSVSSEIAQALNPPAAANGGYANMGSPTMGMGGGTARGGMQGTGGMTSMGGTNVQPVQFSSLIPQATAQEQGNISLIMDVFMEMTVELGRTRKLIKEILGMGEGTIIELDKLAGEPVDILVNHKLIAKGEVVVIDENFGVRVTEIVSPMERMSDLG
jgi:flagellar motor switch protein FliN/FliY